MACVGLLVPCLFGDVLLYVPMLCGFIFGLLAIMMTRGRSVLGWCGLAVHATLLTICAWLILSS